MNRENDSTSLPNERKRVLIVDDEPVVLKSTRRMLERAGYTVSTVETGEAALELLRREGDTIDMVLLDLTLPDIDGAEVLDSMIAIEQNLLVLVTSGYPREEVMARIEGKGAAGVLTKPYGYHELVDAVTAAGA